MPGIASGRGVVGVLALGAGLGALLGALWWALAPRIDLVVYGEQAYPQGFQPREFATSDVIAGGACLAGGIVLATTVIVLARRSRGPAGDLAALGLCLVAAIPGVALLWATGSLLGRVDLPAAIAAAGEGGTVVAPLDLRMPGVLVLWPLASAVIVFVVAIAGWVRGRS